MKPARNLARLCPRFHTCSVNPCPLDEGYLNQFVDRNDKEKQCPMEKGVRLRIAATAPGTLRLSGLTPAEHAGKLAYEQKPVAVRRAMIEKGKAALRKLHSQK